MYGMGDVKKKIMVLNKAIGTQTWMSHTIHFYHLFNFVKENENKLKKMQDTVSFRLSRCRFSLSINPFE